MKFRSCEIFHKSVTKEEVKRTLKMVKQTHDDNTEIGKYEAVKELGQGKYGSVIEIKNSDHKMAVKISALDYPAIYDVWIGCKLNSIKNLTNTFITVYGWLVSPRPANWDNLFLFPASDNKKMLIFMETGDYNWNDRAELHLSKDEINSILFLIIHGLYIAKKKLGFIHQDIHGGNLMLKRVSKPTSTIVSVNDQHFNVPINRFIPKLVDFGRSYLPSIGIETYEDDLSDVAKLFEEWDLDALKIRKTADGKPEYLDEEQILLRYFDNFKIYPCINCSSAATAHWAGQPDYKFCSEKCSNELAPVFEYLPE